MQIVERKLIINSRHYKEILNLLKQPDSDARIVGGSVRDSLLNEIKSDELSLGRDRGCMVNQDIDIITTLLPEEVECRLTTLAGATIISHAKKFGTIFLIYKDEHFEITTLRRDIDSNGRHAIVKFSKDFAEDASRRDFTINALSYCPFENKIFDYFDGTSDLRNSRVRFIGDPKTRITEDYLRIFRFFRFSSYYAKTIDPEGLESCISLQDCLSILSKERIKMEIDKIISSNNIAILVLMHNCGILRRCYEIEASDTDLIFRFLEIVNLLNIELDANYKYIIYALLFCHNKSIDLKKLLYLKFSKKEALIISQTLHFIEELHENSTDLQFNLIWFKHHELFCYFVAITVILKKLELTGAKDLLSKYSNLDLPYFPISGHDLLSRNIYTSKQHIADDLNYLKTLWINSDFSLSKVELLKFFDKKDNN